MRFVPAIVTATGAAGETLDRYVKEHRTDLLADLADARAILFRGFEALTLRDFQAMAESLTGPAIDYEYRSNQRTRLSGRVFNSTDFPASEPIHFHNEMSYFSKWPKHVWFQCEHPAASGGRTLLADATRVYRDLDRGIVEKLERVGVRYIRNMGPDLDVPWPIAFGTDQRELVEEYCRDNTIDFEWHGPDRLRTVQHRPATVRERSTGATVWFNQAHLFHPSSLGADVYRVLQRSFGTEQLPRTATYGDGEAVPVEVLDEIRRVYAAASNPIEWSTNDVLVFDNVRFAHAREPFTPPRSITVTLTGDGRELVE